MSTVFDVTGITVTADVALTTSVNAVSDVVISDTTTPPAVTVSVPTTPPTTTIEVPGLQGPPGDQMVYAQLANPATQYGWGMEDKGKIWIEVNV